METKFSNNSKLMERKPILDKPHRISSQDTVITSTCQCLVPHKVSDFSNSGGVSFPLLRPACVKNMTK
jgi:hypothetical protein